jgi:hypothetical protein
MRTLQTSVLSCGLLLALPASAADAPAVGDSGSSEQVTPPKQPLGSADVRGPGPMMVQPAEVHLPAMGQSTSEDFTFDYHGYFRLPMTLGWNHRKNPAPDQAGTVFHVPAVVPDNNEGTWLYSNTVPNSWANIQMSYGNKYVTGIIGLGAWHFTAAPNNATATGNANVSMGPVLIHIQSPDLLQTKIRLDWDIGAFGNRYGYAGRFDFGQYGMFVIGATGAVGETLGLETDLGDSTFRLEHGFGGNPYVNDSSLGSSLLHHAHLFYGYKQNFKVGLHYMTAWTTDERPSRPNGLLLTSGANTLPQTYSATTDPNKPITEGRETIFGADMRANAGILGSLYVGGSIIKASHADTVAPLIYVLNAVGGRGLRDNFLGGDGSGTISSILLQYDYSFVTLARYLANYPQSYWTNGPDLTLSLFATMSKIKSDSYPVYVTDTSPTPATPPIVDTGLRKTNPTNGETKTKFGGELMYSALPYITFGARFDRVIPWSQTKTDFPSGEAFSVLSPKILVKTNFFSRETLTFQYSHYYYAKQDSGAGVLMADAPFQNRNAAANTANGGSPLLPALNPATSPVENIPYDKDLFYMAATMWW